MDILTPEVMEKIEKLLAMWERKSKARADDALRETSDYQIDINNAVSKAYMTCELQLSAAIGKTKCSPEMLEMLEQFD